MKKTNRYKIKFECCGYISKMNSALEIVTDEIKINQQIIVYKNFKCPKCGKVYVIEQESKEIRRLKKRQNFLLDRLQKNRKSQKMQAQIIAELNKNRSLLLDEVNSLKKEIETTLQKDQPTVG